MSPMSPIKKMTFNKNKNKTRFLERKIKSFSIRARKIIWWLGDKLKKSGLNHWFYWIFLSPNMQKILVTDWWQLVTNRILKGIVWKLETISSKRNGFFKNPFYFWKSLAENRRTGMRLLKNLMNLSIILNITTFVR